MNNQTSTILLVCLFYYKFEYEKKLLIPRETIDLIRERTDILEIIKKFVPTLKKKGKNYIGLCPFHKEKTPSFTVSHEKQIFHCFGCQTGGNIFTFISKVERLNFFESVKYLAGFAGVEITNIETEKNPIFEQGYRINRFAQNFFCKYLNSSEGRIGREYLIHRGIKEGSIELFNIGFAPDSWDKLTGGLKKNSVDLHIGEKIGLLSSSDKNRSHYYDRFRNRIMFPIIDINERTLGFGARRLSDLPTEPMAKYINSPESEIFRKREILYGLNMASASIKELNRVIVVEGYFDVIACHQAGLMNVVASLGTAFTENHAKIISRYCSEAVVLFDSDSAGFEAALKSLEIFSKINVEVRVAMLPDGDPFDFLLKKSLREFMVIVDSAVKPVDFQIKRIIGEFGIKDRINTMIKLFSVIMKIELESEKSIYINKISSLLKIDENSVRKDFFNYVKNGALGSVKKTGSTKEIYTDPVTRIHRDLLKLICNYPELIERAAVDFSPHDISDVITRNIFMKIAEIYYSNQIFSVDKMFDFFENDFEMEFLNKSLIEGFITENPEKAYTEIYIKLKLHEIDAKINKYADKIKNSSGPDNNYLTEIEILRREKEKLNNFVYYQ